MNEDWRSGDLAVCLTSFWQSEPHPFENMIYRLVAVRDGISNLGVPNVRAYFLVFAEFGCNGYVCTAFRKVKPDAEPCEEEFKALIRRPVRVPEHQPVTLKLWRHI